MREVDVADEEFCLLCEVLLGKISFGIKRMMPMHDR